jgi:single-strand DNA-binding protein
MLIGNLGRDPELKMTPSGQALARFSVATTETWKDPANPTGERKSKTEWHNVVVWGKQAEIAEKYLRKGKQVLIEGRIQYREYTDQAGVKKTACDIRCDNFVMLGSKDDGGRSFGGGGVADEGYEPPPAQASGGHDTTYNDDIPF